jgi:MOSC domain-containing protein YiiM
MRGTVVQINASKGGIPKLPVGVATVTERGVVGDNWAHPRFHGGPKQALLLIAMEDLDSLKALGYPVYPGALGENLTMAGIDMRAVRFGDRFRAGEVLLEITKLRQPCRTLDLIRKGIQLELYDTTPGAANWGRGGFYARVIEGGTIRPGDIIAKAEDSDV